MGGDVGRGWWECVMGGDVGSVVGGCDGRGWWERVMGGGVGGDVGREGGKGCWEGMWRVREQGEGAC